MRTLLFLSLALSSLAVADATLNCDGAPNSVGSGAVLRWVGDFDPYEGALRVEGLPAGQAGMMLYSLGGDQVPWGNGTLCLGGGPKWILARAASDSAGELYLDLAADGDQDDLRWLEHNEQLTWFFQYAYRDPAAGGTGFNTSSGLEVRFE
jgi:hypothetical protein